MCSSSGDIVCTLIIEISDIFNERLGAYRKFRLKLRGGGGEEGALICRGVRHRLVERGASQVTSAIGHKIKIIHNT